MTLTKSKIIYIFMIIIGERGERKKTNRFVGKLGSNFKGHARFFN